VVQTAEIRMEGWCVTPQACYMVWPPPAAAMAAERCSRSFL